MKRVKAGLLEARRAPQVLLGLFSALALCLIASPAWSCSVSSDFIPLTNYELVAQAEAVVLARARDEKAGGPYGLNMVRFEVVEVIKGKGLAKGDSVVGAGRLGKESYRGRGKVDDFSRARPGAYTGSCRAVDYRKGRFYVLMLAQREGQWRTSGPPFSRMNEEVNPKGEPWLVAVRAYAKISAMGDPKLEDAALKKLRASAASGGRHRSEALVNDIDWHFKSPSPSKSSSALKAMYDATKDAPARGRIILAIGKGGDANAAPLMREVIQDLEAFYSGGRVNKLVGTAAGYERGALLKAAVFGVANYYEAAPGAVTFDSIASLYVAIGPKHKQTRWPLMWTLIKQADGRHAEAMVKALGSADDEEMGRLAQYFVRHPHKDAVVLIKKMVDEQYETHTDAALALAGMGDKDVLSWASKRLRRVDRDRGRWVAAYIAARSPLPEANALAGRIIYKGGKDLASLVDGYAEATHANADGRLEEIEAREDNGAAVEKALKRTARRRKR